jgi:hypothetical protein
MSEPLTIEERARRRRRRTAGWTTIAGLAVLAGAALVAWSWRGELPDPVASHWGPDDTPDGFSSLTAVLSVMLVAGSLLVLGFGAITMWFGHSALTRRVGVAATVWSALFFTTLTVGSLNQQRGLADARAAGGIGGVLLLSLFGPLVLAVIVAISVAGDERQPTTEPVDPSAPRVTQIAGSVTWTGAAASPMAMVLGLAAAVLVLALVLLSQFWGLLVVVVLVVALIAAMSSAVVRVDGGGVTIRSSLGWPRTHVPLDEIVRADVTDVRPLRDFGGWGWRVGRKGRVGIVLRRGEALLVERTGGRSVVVTVDGAATAAGLVNVLADRARPQSPDRR